MTTWHSIREGNGVSVDFDVFAKIESNQAAHGIASQWWKVLKRVIKDYREYLDKRCSQDWGRRIGMLASQDLLCQIILVLRAMSIRIAASPKCDSKIYSCRFFLEGIRYAMLSIHA